MFMPNFATFFLILTFANIGFPGTSSFIGEFLILLGLFSVNSVVGFFAGFSVILSAAYAVWLYNRVFFGVCNTNYIKKTSDVCVRDFVCYLFYVS